jgi:sulfoxide reductase heme-binding subunit YedZ
MQRWKKLHRFTLLAWVLGLAHSLGEGTDAGRLWFLASVGFVVLPVLMLVALRVSGALSTRVSATIPAR